MLEPYEFLIAFLIATTDPRSFHTAVEIEKAIMKSSPRPVNDIEVSGILASRKSALLLK